jgi:hypothetical protein
MRTCVDINECDSSELHNCSEICTNTAGGFECSCSNDKILSIDGASCDEADPCSIDNGGCSQICSPHASHRKAVCSCRKGYAIDFNDPSKCMDINECETKHQSDAEKNHT